MTFTGGGASAASAPALAQATTAAPAATSVTVNAGTTLLVRMVDGVSSKDSKGKRFTTTLEIDLVVNGTMVAKAGTKVYGRIANVKSAGRFAGKSELDLRLAELTVGSQLLPLMSSPYQQAGANSLSKTAKAAGAGAVIGNNTGDGDAKSGAAIGVGVGALKKGEQITVSPGTLLEFQLQQPLTVNIGG